MSKTTTSTHGKFKPSVTLDPHENVSVIIGVCRQIARAAGWSREDIDKWSADAKEMPSNAAFLDYLREHFDIREAERGGR